jgi:nucleotide-binding universal stress UspA family protein
MYSSILVPLDGSQSAEHALPVAIGIARRSGARLHLVCAHAPPVFPAGSPQGIIAADAEWLVALRKGDEEYLRITAERCVEQTGLVVRTDAPSGPAAQAIGAAAQDGGDSLIVMTTHGRGGISRAWLGSVADAVVRRSGVPVLLTRPDETRLDLDSWVAPHHILIPVDGSHLSEGIIDAALAFGSVTGAHCTLLRVVPPFPTPLYVLGVAAGADSTAYEQLRTNASDYLGRLAERLRSEHGFEVNVDVKLVENYPPATAILDAAASLGVDMIAMATHGRGGWSRLALGSVADKVMRGASVPVLIHRPPASVPDGEGAQSATDAMHAA